MDAIKANITEFFSHILYNSSLPNLAIILGIVVFLGTLGGHLFQKLKTPQVVGYFVIGILVGSSGFQIFPPKIIEMLSPVTTIALAFIGFLVGGELKTETVKKMGKQFVSVLMFEAIVPAIIVAILVTGATYIFTHNFVLAISFGIVMGAICSSTAPEATTNVLQEYRARGPMTSMIYGLVAMDDAIALILFAICSTIAAPLLGGAGSIPSFGMQMVNIAKNIFGSMAVGALFGFLLQLILRPIMNKEGLALSITLGLLLLCTGVCSIEKLGLSNILAAMSAGFVVANFAPKKVQSIFKTTNKFTPPIYVLFFVVVGAKINIWGMKPLMLVVAALYIVGRTSGKAIGSWFGAKITRAPKTIAKFIKYCLLSQAGVAIGLSITAAEIFKNSYFPGDETNSIGNYIVLIVTFTTFFAELIGPVFVKYGIQKAGEAGMNVTEEDIRMKSKVCDVTWGTEKVCDPDNISIVDEMETLDGILEKFETSHHQSFAVVDENKKLLGTISLEHLKETLLLGEMAEGLLAIDIMDTKFHSCYPETLLPDVDKMFSENDVEQLAIMDKDGKVYGMIEKFAMDHYVHTRLLELERKLNSLDENR